MSANTEIRPAATLILARPAAVSFEIMMLKRTTKAAFASGMYVFPGGRIDASDSDPVLAPYITEPRDHQHAQIAALGEDWLGAYVAAIRETFEEAGILMAKDANGSWVTLPSKTIAETRQSLHQGELSMADLCRTYDARLAINELNFYNRWTTPPGRPRRFDTRFFVGQAPPMAEGVEDGEETTDAVWITPIKALEEHQAGRFDLMSVTVKQLSAITEYKNLVALKMALSHQDTFPHYQPPDYLPS